MRRSRRAWRALLVVGMVLGLAPLVRAHADVTDACGNSTASGTVRPGCVSYTFSGSTSTSGRTHRISGELTNCGGDCGPADPRRGAVTSSVAYPGDPCSSADGKATFRVTWADGTTSIAKAAVRVESGVEHFTGRVTSGVFAHYEFVANISSGECDGTHQASGGAAFSKPGA